MARQFGVAPDQFQMRYSRLDRCLHRMAFSTIWCQKTLADIEDGIWRERLAQVEIERPVFVAGLPRAGTTLLLEMLSALPDFASHTYRHMPFVLTPLLWEAYSRPFRKPEVEVERAHGDGVTIGYDAPAALEEVVWRAFWPEKYRKDRIVPWTAEEQDQRGEFDAFFRAHVAKVVLLGRGRGHDDGQGDGPRPHDGLRRRYLSKNNANVSRVPKLKRLFPDAVVIVPFRDPVAQGHSLHRQHLRFLEMHEAEPFARRYMADLGHFEFGANLRPIDFGQMGDAGALRVADGLRAADGLRRADDPNFWLRYWCSAYRQLLALSPGQVALTSYDALCSDPVSQLDRLGAVVGLERRASLEAMAGRVRAPREVPPEVVSLFDPRLLAEAKGIHADLEAGLAAPG